MREKKEYFLVEERERGKSDSPPITYDPKKREGGRGEVEDRTLVVKPTQKTIAEAKARDKYVKNRERDEGGGVLPAAQACQFGR